MKFHGCLMGGGPSGSKACVVEHEWKKRLSFRDLCSIDFKAMG